MNLWHKITSWFSKPTAVSPFYKKVVAVRGEANPGYLSLDVGTFSSEDDQPTGDAGINIQLEITPKLRPTANRVLAGLETEDDESVIELAIQKLL